MNPHDRRLRTRTTSGEPETPARGPSRPRERSIRAERHAAASLSGAGPASRAEDRYANLDEWTAEDIADVDPEAVGGGVAQASRAPFTRPDNPIPAAVLRIFGDEEARLWPSQADDPWSTVRELCVAADPGSAADDSGSS